jgi:tetratricopeptide (TPR) repeat protein
MTTPPHHAALLARAAALLRAGRPSDAVAPLRQAAAARPGNAAILHDLGLACLESGQLDAAIDALQQAVAANPRFADAHLRLGIVQEAAGLLDAALMSYRRASVALPSLADARYREAELLDSLGRIEEAAACYRRAASSAPKTTQGRMAAARVLLAAGRDTEAEKILRQALALDRGNAAVLELLGTVLAEAGRFQEARAVLAQAIEMSPARAGAYYDLLRCGAPADAALVARMRAAVHETALDAIQLSRLHLALGKAAHDDGDYEEAMTRFDAAERLRNTQLRFDPAAFDALVDRLIATFTPQVFERAAPEGGPGPAPIFIVGLPRSGTTLVEQILSAHGDVRAGGEVPFWMAQGPVWEHEGAETRAAMLDTLPGAYGAVLRGIGGTAGYVTDKMPLNILWAGLIHLAFPNATILQCTRAPIETALSIHATHFNPRMAFPTGGAALVGYIGGVARLAAHWRRVLPAGRFITIDHAVLTAAPETEIPRLLKACGLAWDAACLHPEQNPRAIRTASKYQARQAIYRTADRAPAYRAFLGALAPLG